jgi:4-hydroxythreonine-4-phosphate dehydrogenase
MLMTLGMTLGDPSGIGPEIVARALVEEGADGVRVYGDHGLLERAAALQGLVLPPVEIVEVGALACTPGQPNTESGRAQIAYLERALDDAAALDGLVTAPIHKASAMAAGLAFPGHTELLAARLAGGGPVTMMFAGPRLRVSLATIHLPLAAVPGALTVDGLAGTIVRTARALVDDFGITKPRLAVAGLNPHAGEGGHFGDEESRLIAPAISRARADLGEAVTVTGPHVPDAIFRSHLDGASDAVVALYHDQGLIPVKTVDFDEAVNLTLGLPLVRTSPDHGVAHDIAGRGIARATSMRAALRLARNLANRRKRASHPVV